MTLAQRLIALWDHPGLTAAHVATQMPGDIADLAATHPGRIWRYREDHVLSQLNEAETAIWRAATQAARAEGLLFMANPLHRAVGIKPVA